MSYTGRDERLASYGQWALEQLLPPAEKRLRVVGDGITRYLTASESGYGARIKAHLQPDWTGEP